MTPETEEQKKDHIRLQKYIERERLVSIMNNTKWNLLQTEFSYPSEISPKYRTKILRSTSEPYWETDWQYHFPYPAKVIEWIEINPIFEIPRGAIQKPNVFDKSEQIQSILKNLNIPYSIENEFIKVWGYKKPGVEIAFITSKKS